MYATNTQRARAAVVESVGTVFVTNISSTETLRGTFLPTLLFNRESMAALIAVLGTTISPYLFFWQSAEEAEQNARHSESKTAQRRIP